MCYTLLLISNGIIIATILIITAIIETNFEKRASLLACWASALESVNCSFKILTCSDVESAWIFALSAICCIVSNYSSSSIFLYIEAGSGGLETILGTW